MIRRREKLGCQSKLWLRSYKRSSVTYSLTLLYPSRLIVYGDVIYNAFYPLGAPDIIFESEDEDFHPLSMMAEGGEIQTTKSSLSDWNSRDPTKLLSLIHELRSEMDMDAMSLYMSYQRKRVGELDDARLKFEISTIIFREGIEMCLFSGLDKAEEVKFVVPLLDMDLNKLVHGSPWRQQQKIYLQVVFPVTRKYSGAPSAPRLKLIASSELKALFSTDDIKLPPWVDGMCMAEYLPTLEENLRAQLVEAAASNGARRRFIEALVPLFGRPLEADPESHSSISFWRFYISGALSPSYSVPEAATDSGAPKFSGREQEREGWNVPGKQRCSLIGCVLDDFL
ncbi:hypothetical protein ACLOJK_027986 [Asimina triloba]